MSKTAVSIT